MRIPRFIAFACTAVLAASLTACSGASRPQTGATGGAAFQVTPTSPPAQGPLDSFTWSLYAEPYTLDYALAYDYPPNTVLANVCEQLLRVTPDLKIEPGLAVKWEQPDPLTLVYTLRPGVKFHDGTTMAAEDVVASLKRQMDPATGSPWASSFKNVHTIEATGPLEVTIRLTKADVLFHELMAASPGTVVSAASLAKEGPDYGTPKGALNCTGPFALDKWVQGDSITLREHPAYWDKALAPKSRSVKFTFIEDAAARSNAFLSGTADGGYLVPSSSLAQLRAGGNGALLFGPNTAAANLAVLDFEGPLGNLKVRKALSMALDRKNIINAAAGGVGVPAKAPAARGAWALVPEKAATLYDTLPDLAHDVEGARKLVKEAGATGRTVTLVTSTLAPEISVVANAVQAAGRQIGLDVKLKSVSPRRTAASSSIRRPVTGSTSSSPTATTTHRTRWSSTSTCAPATSGTTATGPTPDSTSPSTGPTPSRTRPSAPTSPRSSRKSPCARCPSSPCTRHRTRSSSASGSPAPPPASASSTTRGPRRSGPHRNDPLPRRTAPGPAGRAVRDLGRGVRRDPPGPR